MIKELAVSELDKLKDKYMKMFHRIEIKRSQGVEPHALVKEWEKVGQQIDKLQKTETSTEWVPAEEQNKMSLENLQKLNKMLQARGWKLTMKAKRSAGEDIRWSKADKDIFYSGWHGTGKWGFVKVAMTLYYGNKLSQMKPVVDDEMWKDTKNFKTSASGFNNVAISKEGYEKQKVLWQKMFNWVEKNA